MQLHAVSARPARARVDPIMSSQEARFHAFGLEIDAVKTRIFAKLGEEDVRHVRRLDLFSRSMEAVGRVLIHVSLEPVSFLLGVGALWVHKQLQATEIGHTALHGAYDKLPGGEAFASKTFSWDTPIDEEAWRNGHNVRHHGNTNVAGKDADIHYGPARLTVQTPHRFENYTQLPATLGIVFPNFGFMMNLHYTGMLDIFTTNGLAKEHELDFLPDRSWRSIGTAWRKSLRKFVPYYFKNYVLFPALAGPFFWKVLLGNWMAELMRDVYSAATIYCGHVGEDVKSYPIGKKAQSRGEWYAMQVESTNNFDVSAPWNVFCGGLERQIEHHLFPSLPPQRLREIAPEVRAICERHGVAYRQASWGRTLKKAFAHIAKLSSKGGARAVLSEMA